MKLLHIKISIVLALLCGMLSNAQTILTPSEAIKQALENNYAISIANNAVAVAKNNSSIFNSGYLPTLTGNVGANFNLDNTEATFANGNKTILNGAESSRYNASINLNYILFDGLGRRYNFKRLKEEHQLSKLQVRETIENTTIQLFSIYYSVAQLTENLTTLQETLKVSKERLVRAQYQFDYGQNTKLAVLNAEVDIVNDSINIINTKQQLKNGKRDLSVVLGTDFKTDFTVETELNFILQIKKDSLFEMAKKRNTALLQIEKNTEITSLNIQSEKAAYLPTIGLIGSYGWNKNNNNAAAFVAGSINTGLSAGLNLTWNLFDGGNTLTRVRNAKLNLETQQLQMENLLLDIQRNFDNIWDTYKNKLAIYDLQESNIRTAQNNFDRTQEKFKVGQVNSLDFRQAQLNLINAELSRNQAKYEAKLAELDLLQLSGVLLEVAF